MKPLLTAVLLVFFAACTTTTVAKPTEPSPDCLNDVSRVERPPRFGDFPAKPVKVTPAAPMMNNKLARLFRTELRRQAKAGPNFTGAFTITNWSCGVGCLDFAIVDVRSGQVFDPGVGGISAVFNAAW